MRIHCVSQVQRHHFFAAHGGALRLLLFSPPLYVYVPMICVIRGSEYNINIRRPCIVSRTCSTLQHRPLFFQRPDNPSPRPRIALRFDPSDHGKVHSPALDHVLEATILDSPVFGSTSYCDPIPINSHRALFEVYLP